MRRGDPWCSRAARDPLGLASAVLITVLLADPSSASAWNWKPALSAGNKAEAEALPAPSAPTGVSATCVSSSLKEITVSWGAVTHASTYTVYDSTTSASGTYASKATGVTATSWTSASLAVDNYWFEVTAYVGTKWLSAYSAASAETTIASSVPECKQP
jgi:hypothetical protein